MQSMTGKREYEADCSATVKARILIEAVNATGDVSDLL